MAVGWSNPGDRGGAQCVEMVNRSHRSEGGFGERVGEKRVARMRERHRRGAGDLCAE
jgi:hypothetical protein